MQYWIVAAGGPQTYASWQQNGHGDMGSNVSGSSLTSLVRDPDTNDRGLSSRRHNRRARTSVVDADGGRRAQLDLAGARAQ
ncbi:MAG: hypothetical protein DMG57_20085 [Acidobacteria bacterium]|nr:MAG: hypothetical protein DMG57_20085 [Acidobacteriota bacterium]